MDIGKFKASRARLLMWIVLPPLVFTGIGLSAYALRLQAEWDLNRAQLFSQVLPELVQTQNQARDLLQSFHESDAYSVQSEDDFIAYIREIERKSDFTVDTLEVERLSSDDNMSVLIAVVEMDGEFKTIEKFISDVVSGQHLLFGSQLSITQITEMDASDTGVLQAEITFEMILLDALKSVVGEGE
jgi:hypothetical protein